MESKRFKTMVGYCYLYPDRIVIARSGSPEGIDFEKEEKRMWKYRLFYLIIGLLFLRQAFLCHDNLFLCFGLCMMSVYLLFAVLKTLKQSSAALIERERIRSVVFSKGVKYITRPRFIVYFEDRKGRIKSRYIMLPGSLNNGEHDTECALRIMRETGYLE